MKFEVTDELITKAAQFGYMGLFDHRDTLQEALDNATNMISAMHEDGAPAMVALMVFVNTNALMLAKQGQQKDAVVGELRELARATLAYCEQGSRSIRRRAAMIKGAHEALDHAEKEFGPEDT